MVRTVLCCAVSGLTDRAVHARADLSMQTTTHYQVAVVYDVSLNDGLAEPCGSEYLCYLIMQCDRCAMHRRKQETTSWFNFHFARSSWCRLGGFYILRALSYKIYVAPEDSFPFFPVSLFLKKQIMFSTARTVASRVAIRASATNAFASLRRPQTLRHFAASVRD
jgi:hypothetical protein